MMHFTRDYIIKLNRLLLLHGPKSSVCSTYLCQCINNLIFSKALKWDRGDSQPPQKKNKKTSGTVIREKDLTC